MTRKKCIIITMTYFVGLLALHYVLGVLSLRGLKQTFSGNGEQDFYNFVAYGKIVLNLYYYLVPFAFAIVSSFLYRPILSSFSKVLVGIFGTHLITSIIILSISIPYSRYLKEQDLTLLAESANVTISNQIENDTDQDGLVNSITLNGVFHKGKLPNGTYFLDLRSGTDNFQWGGIGIGGQFKIEVDKGEEKFSQTFKPEELKNTGIADLSTIPISVSLKYDRPARISLAKPVLLLHQLGAFSRLVPISISPESMYRDIVFLKKFVNVYNFKFDTSKLEREFLIVSSYSDFGQDTNNDGLFDQLVISMEVDSIWEGSLYFHAYFKDNKNKIIRSTTTVRKGISTIEFIVDSKELIEFGKNGPYHFTNFYIENNNPKRPPQ